jgi:YD repeat-containing protein
MAQYVLRVDPNSINRARVQALIDDLNSRNGSQQFLNIPGRPGGTLYVTDNANSPVLTDANRAQIRGYGPGLGGYSQSQGQPTEYINFDSDKPPINILVHEVGHQRWPGLGTDAAGHDPVFYRLLNDALTALGIPVDPAQDLHNIDIDNVPSPVPSGTSPLNYSTRRQRSDAGSDQDSADLASAESSESGWNVALNADNTLTEGRSVQGETDTLRYDANGNLLSRTVSRADGTGNNETFDADGNLTSASGTNTSGSTWSENLNGDNSTFTFAGQVFGGPQFTSSAGLTLGSTIGGILGGNSIAGRIVGSTVLGTLGQSVGDALVRSGLGSALIGNGTLTSSMFDQAVTTTIADFGGNLAPNAIGNIAGSFSSLLFGEAAQALGLHGFAGGLFTTIGTSITSQLATNLGAMTLNSIAGTTLTTNFSPESFIGNISGAIGGYFGSYLAAEIVPANGIAGSIGGRIGGAIGGFLASEIPVVGTFFGSLVGSVLGTLVGSLFDPHIVPWSSEMVGAVNGVLGINFWNWNQTGNPQEFTALSNMVAGNANQVLALTRRDPSIMNITGLTSLNELVFNQLGSTLTAIYPDGNRTDFYVNGMPQWFALQALYNTGEIATYELVQHAVLVGSDPIVTGALAAARVFPRRRLGSNEQRHVRNAQLTRVKRPHTRLIHRGERRPACG